MKKKPASRQKEVTAETLCGHVNRAGGQLIGIGKMMRQKRPHEDVLIQFLAVEKALHKIIYEHFNVLIRQHLWLRIMSLSAMDNLPLQCASFVDSIRMKFPDYELKHLPKVFYDLKVLSL